MIENIPFKPQLSKMLCPSQKKKNPVFSLVAIYNEKNVPHNYCYYIFNFIQKHTEIYFLPILEAGKSKVKIQQNWFLVKVLAGWQPATFSMCLHRAFPQYVYMERDSSSYKALIPSWHPTLMISPKLNYLSKAPPPDTILLGARASTYDLGQHSSVCCRKVVLPFLG